MAEYSFVLIIISFYVCLSISCLAYLVRRDLSIFWPAISDTFFFFCEVFLKKRTLKQPKGYYGEIFSFREFDFFFFKKEIWRAIQAFTNKTTSMPALSSDFLDHVPIYIKGGK